MSFSILPWIITGKNQYYNAPLAEDQDGRSNSHALCLTHQCLAAKAQLHLSSWLSKAYTSLGSVKRAGLGKEWFYPTDPYTGCRFLQMHVGKEPLKALVLPLTKIRANFETMFRELSRVFSISENGYFTNTEPQLQCLTALIVIFFPCVIRL